MDALKLLFASDVEPISLGVIAFTIAMGFRASSWFGRKIAESERQHKH